MNSKSKKVIQRQHATQIESPPSYDQVIIADSRSSSAQSMLIANNHIVGSYKLMMRCSDIMPSTIICSQPNYNSCKSINPNLTDWSKRSDGKIREQCCSYEECCLGFIACL